MSVRARAFTIKIEKSTNLDFVNIFKIPSTYTIVGYITSKNIICYIYNKNKLSSGKLQKMFPNAVIEKAEGSPKENRQECVNTLFFKESGKLPLQGRRTDINKKVVAKPTKESITKLTLRWRSLNNDATKMISTIKNLRLEMELGGTPTKMKNLEAKLATQMKRKPILIRNITMAKAALDKAKANALVNN